MKTRTVLLIGMSIGLATSGAVLALMWFGVSGVLQVNSVDLRSVFWPLWAMLLTSWRTTTHGVMTTIIAVVINCLLYMAIAYALLSLVRVFRKPLRPARQ
jgi:hypothetical protein